MAQFDINQLQALETEFNGLAKRMREIHDTLKTEATSDVPVQKRYFFYSGVVEIEMDQDELDSLDLDPGQISPQFVKNKIEVAIMDETPFIVSEYGGYCSEVAGGVKAETVDLTSEEQ